MSATATPFGMADLARVTSARRGLILRVALGVIGLTVIVLALWPASYTASAVVMLDRRRNTVAAQSEVLSDLPTDAASLQNQIQILTSRDLAAEVIGNEKLYDDPEFNAALSDNPFAGLSDLLHPSKWFSSGNPSETGRDAIIDSVLRHLNVEEQGLSTSFTVSFASRDARKSATIANAFVQAYVHDQLQTKYEAAQKTTQWLQARVAQLAAQVEAAEAAVQDYKAKHDLNEGADGVSLADQQTAAINTQLVTARADLAQKEAVAARVKALRASGDAADVSQAVDSPVIVALRGQEAALIQQEADLSARYGPKHPKLIAVEQQRRDLESKIAEEVSRIAGSLANDVAVAKANVASLETSLDGAEKIAGVENAARVELKALEANAASTRDMYEAFVTRLRETQGQDAIQLPDTRVLSPAPVPAYPSSPKRLVIFAASVPAGFLLGLLIALMAERAGPQMQTIRRFEPVARPAPRPSRAPVLARMADAASPRAADYVYDWPGSQFAQSLNALMHGLATPARGARPHVVGVASAMPGAAKSNIAMGLARVASRAGWRVVALDGDFAANGLGRAAGQAHIRGGLLDALARKAPLSRSFAKDPRSNVLMLGAGPVSNSAAIAASPVMAQLLSHLRNTTDLVIVDCPPVLAGPPVLARQADFMLLVVDPKDPAAAIDAALAALGSERTALILAG
ncbi:MAG TPA: exopolysaccharide transport family protein [Rhizomicrobium sp.]|nr:exopolysaccharide transport family protein [Rhizomicrobium sp.]